LPNLNGSTKSTLRVKLNDLKFSAYAIAAKPMPPGIKKILDGAIIVIIISARIYDGAKPDR
jgi:hypothetical protein